MAGVVEGFRWVLQGKSGLPCCIALGKSGPSPEKGVRQR